MTRFYFRVQSHRDGTWRWHDVVIEAENKDAALLRIFPDYGADAVVALVKAEPC